MLNIDGNYAWADVEVNEEEFRLGLGEHFYDPAVGGDTEPHHGASFFDLLHHAEVGEVKVAAGEGDGVMSDNRYRKSSLNGTPD